MKFRFDTVHEAIPAKSPGSDWQVRGPTTQVMVRLAEWPDNIFRLWMPEMVGKLWNNWNTEVARQDFNRTQSGGLRWTYELPRQAHIDVELTPLETSLVIESRVANLSDALLSDVVATKCLQLSLAPDFACGDLTRLHIRSDHKWSTLAALSPSSDYPHYFRTGRRESFRDLSSDSPRPQLYEAVEADHPLMVCVTPDGDRSVGTASDDFEYLFHNRANPHLWCIHSHQTPVTALEAGRTAVFRQKVYFVDGGLDDCVSAYEADPVRP